MLITEPDFMINFYQTNLLIVAEIGEHTVYIDGGEYGLVPLHHAPDGVEPGDEVEAYVYADASDTVIATMAESYAEVGECAFLRVAETGGYGTFLDWGLPKDLVLPMSELWNF